MILGINASRARSGGAKAHLIGILTEGDPTIHGFDEVHIWSYSELLNELPDTSWLFKHNPSELTGSILRQVWWERYSLPKELRAVRCSILFNVDAGSVCRFKPAVTLSQDLLAFELGEMERLGFSKARIRQILLYYIQKKSLKYADGAIFLTRYAATVIQKSCGQLKNVAIIPHGVDEKFRKIANHLSWPLNAERPIRCIYVSPIWKFKHQWVVVRAIEALRKKGYDITLTLVGGEEKTASIMLEDQIRQSDPEGVFVYRLGVVSKNDLQEYLANSDLFVFASSCETFGITLLEGMSVGLPIACSNRSSLPETLKDGGVYFDPEDASSIEMAIEKVITDEPLCICIAQRAKELSKKYSWKKCTKETFTFIFETAKKSKE